MDKNDQALQELQQLIDLQSDDELSQAESQRFAQLLSDDRSLREVYYDHLEMKSLLSWELHRPQTDQLPANLNNLNDLLKKPEQQKSPILGFLGNWTQSLVDLSQNRFNMSVMVAFLTIASFLIVSALIYLPQNEANRGRDLAKSQNFISVAKITRLNNARWSDGEEHSRSELMQSGEWLKLESGEVEITFNSGVQVLLQGKSHFRVSTDMASQLVFGKLTVEVPHKAKGYTIHTELAVVKDLGTEFGVQVSEEGAVLVHVFGGKVEVGPSETSQSKFPKRVLTAGQCVAIQRGSNIVDVAPDAKDAEQFITVYQAQQPERYRQWLTFSRKLKKDPDLIAYYLFDNEEQAADSILNRSLKTAGSLNAKLGVPKFADSKPVWTRGRWLAKRALRFNSELNQRAVIADFSKFTPAKNLSISMWVRLTFDQPTNTLLCQWEGPRQKFFHISLREHGPTLRFPGPTGEGGEFVINPKQKPIHSKDGWTHLVACFSSDGKVSVYQNGKQIIDKHDLKIINQFYKVSAPLLIGGRLGGGSGFTGVVDEIALFNRMLNENEITEMYEIGKPK